MAMALGDKGPMVEMNVTPLIDVLLVLIITFMVITPLTPSGLDALVPQPDPNAKPDEQVLARTVVITIDRGRNIKINQGEPVDIRDLGNRLDDIFKNRNERIIFVKGDDSLEFITVARVIDVAKGVGIDKIGLVTESLQESQ
ncbi:MAG: biopolymer transporter ExbD [Acidobacteria bacterium]|nr:MAG: biopolymer transporter ExbD [Acidobacteriota bacterium]